MKDLSTLALEITKPFIGAQAKQRIEKNTIHLVGFPFDGTTSYRPGSRFAPDAIRDASTNLETYSPYLNMDLEDHGVIDIGNILLHPARWDLMSSIYKRMVSGVHFEKDNVRMLTMGGEHSISYDPIVTCLKQYKDLIVLHLDAHTDLRDGYLGAPYSHASVIRRVWEQMGPKHRLIQYGIRSGTRDEFQFMKKEKTLIESLDDLCETLWALRERPVYLTLDLDFFDPAFFPGTGTPEAGGEDFMSFIGIMHVLQEGRLIGSDVVELAPTIDPTGNSSCFASKIVREVMLAMAASMRTR